MANIFITGSADGLGQLTAKALVKAGHRVVLHARNEERGRQALAAVPEAQDVLIADLSSVEETKVLANQANAFGKFNVVIHNAGLFHVSRQAKGPEGIQLLFAVNTLAPYILTCLMEQPERLIYLSSDMHLQGDPGFDKTLEGNKSSIDQFTYSDTKLHDLILALAVANKWPHVCANAVDPGWVPTKMGGPAAPDNLQKGFETQVWLASSEEPDALSSGHYYHHKKQFNYLRAAGNPAVQENLLALCKEVTGISFPSATAV
jgi:NAD(P)-dependent dehydrogenase (short-subunit alcohol dehydrogenase family)